MGTPGKRLDEATRKRIQAEIKQGLSRRNVARRNGVSTRTIHEQIKRMSCDGEARTA